MRKKPEERMTMKDILRHPFITKYSKNTKINQSIISEFRKALTA
jgi:hypothetical protein